MPRLCDRIGIIGGGFVGRAIARGFMEHCGEVRIHDAMPERSTHTLREALDCDWTFVCLPTPARDDGRCDTSIIEGVLAKAHGVIDGGGLPTDQNPPVLVIKSTVPVGFTRRMHERYAESMVLLHSPEFLTQRCALVDFQTPARNIVGWPRGAVGEMVQKNLNDAIEDLVDMYERRFPGVECFIMSSDESELVKLAQNGFFATKVAYFNAIYQLAQATGCDFEAVRAGMLADGRIAHAHTEVPGPSGELGFGGACLSKDLQNLISLMWDCGRGELQPETGWLFGVYECNKRRRGE